MQEIELPKVKELNLRTSGWVQYYNPKEELEDNEVVLVKNVGKCRVREICTNLVELWKLKKKK